MIKTYCDACGKEIPATESRIISAKVKLLPDHPVAAGRDVVIAVNFVNKGGQFTHEINDDICRNCVFTAIDREDHRARQAP